MMTLIMHDIKTFLKFLDSIYVNNPDDWWIYNKDRLQQIGVRDNDATFYEILADVKKLIEFAPNSNRVSGKDETRIRLTKYGHDNIDNLDPVLSIPSNNNPKLN